MFNRTVRFVHGKPRGRPKAGHEHDWLPGFIVTVRPFMPEPPHSQKDRSTGHASCSRKSRSRSREILDAPRRPRDHYGSENKREPRDHHRTTRGRSRSRSRSPPSRRRRSKSRSRSPQRHRLSNHRSRSRSRSPLRRKSKSRSRSRSRGRGDSHGHGGSKRRAVSRSRSRARSEGSSSSAGSQDEHHKKRKKHKHRKRSRSRDKKERKKDRKHKKDKKKKDKGSSTAQWGKYGILAESDIYTKDAEFRSWLVEERVINPETITKDQTKKEFARFMEDFNTATLPHEKYYNMEHYEMRMSLLRNGETLPPTDDAYDPNADLLAHSSAHKRAPTERESYLSKEQVQELRRVQQERLQVGKMKQMGLEVKQTMGVRMVDAPE